MPKTIFWFRIYCGLLAFLYLLVTAGGIAFLVIPAETLEMARTEAVVIGSLFIAMGLVFFIMTFLGLFLPQRPGGWIYGLVLICIGLTSAVFLPICIPLLLFWLKQPVQAWFGRNPS